PVHLVDLGRLLDPARLEALDIVTLGAGEGVEDIGGEIAMLGDQLVLDHHGMVDRVVAALAQRRSPASSALGMSGLMSGDFTSTPMAAASSPDASISPMFLPFSIGTTLAGARYSATCSSPESTQVILLKSTPCSSCRMLRAHTPVVTV